MSRFPGMFALVSLVAACGGRDRGDARKPPPAPPTVAIDATPPATDARPAPTPAPFAPLGTAPPVVRDADGIPILDASPRAAGGTGGVRWLGAADQVLQFPASEATDGRQVYVALDRAGRDLVVRDGVVSEDVLAARGALPGGCVGAHDGVVYLAAPAITDRDQQVQRRAADGTVTTTVEKARGQRLWTVGVDGAEAVRELPTVDEDRCRLTVGGGGRWVYDGFRHLTWDGRALAEDRGRMGLRLTLGRVDGPAYCFESCNAAERAANPPATETVRAALPCPATSWIAQGDRVAGACADAVVRYREGGKPEVLPLPHSPLIGGPLLAFTDRGDLVIGLDYRFRRYRVWPAGGAALGPERTLAAGELIAHASPTARVRGLGGGVPEAQITAVLLGKTIGYGANGGTYGYASIDRSGPAPYRGQLERAKAVLGDGDLLAVHEAIVDRRCGAFVRSPVGWEDEEVSDWIPPVLPALSPRAVTRPKACTALDEVHAVPGEPSLLLARAGDRLLAAWLPPPLPLPPGDNPMTGRKGGVPVQHPRPGVPWFDVGPWPGRLDGLDGVAAPGGDTVIHDGSWQAAGAMVLTLADASLVLSPAGASTLPPDTKPMALSFAGTGHVWGAQGNKLVDCARDCRVLDPGVASELVAVVPRSATELVIGFADGRVGVYVVPASGGAPVPRHPLATALDAALARRPD